MIFGIVITLAGYSIFYWGVHHFPGWDCNACPPKNDCCRYSLLELLGVPKAWGIAKYSSVGITPGNQPPATTQQQNAENQTTGGGLTNSNSPFPWLNSVLQGLNAPTSFNNQNKLSAWNACEGNLQGHSGMGINNPFNTTLNCCGGISVPGNSAGVKSYPTLTAGIQATVQTLQSPRYKAIVSNLVNDGTFQAFANAVGSSGWGTSGSCIARSGS